MRPRTRWNEDRAFVQQDIADLYAGSCLAPKAKFARYIESILRLMRNDTTFSTSSDGRLCIESEYYSHATRVSFQVFHSNSNIWRINRYWRIGDSWQARVNEIAPSILLKFDINI